MKMSKLIVTVDSAANLPNVDTFGESDPFCIVEIKGLKGQTKVIDNDLNPVWKEKIELDLGPPLSPDDKLTVTVKDHETIGPDKLLGMCEIALKDLVKGGKSEMEVNAPLQDANKRAVGATVKVMIVYVGPKGKGTGVHYTTDSSPSGGGGGQTMDAEDDDEEEEAFDQADGGGGGGGGGGKKSRRKRNVGGAAKRKTRAKLSTKLQDFQIRIRIVEARQLQGANISPVCRVTCYNQMKQTRIKKSTNSPYWGETFFFNFNVSPADLMEELVECGVFNSRRLRSDAMIGAFKFDLGMLYEEDGHVFLNKWLLLSDPEDPQGGAKGYLKICAVILGPGDEAPSFKQASSADEDEDIESNLLRPAGVQLRPATFTLRVYRAEDLPKMDTEIFQGVRKIFTGTSTKELVDPYLVFQFAGKEVRTETKYTNDHPEWNEELRMGLQFPSMCERIKFQMFDWDRMTEDDIIGTNYIDIPLISAQGDTDKDSEGYLPMFGPCFVNFYGSPREFSELGDQYESLNEGKGEGVAYRGRVLLELKTELGETPEQSKEEIGDDQLLKVQKFLRRRKYRLHAAFSSASMISEVDAPVEFEISIGNYGNKLDESVPPTASTTQPTNAVFDGVHYYFLPWGNTKPCTVVESQWEDIGFRLHSINFLHRILEKLDENIEKIHVAIKAKLPDEEQAQFTIAAIDDLIVMCNKDLPEWEPGQSPANELDLNLQSLRENELKNIRRAASKLREECTSVEEAVNELDSFRNQIRAIAIEPQNSFPDVVIWMLCADKRIAYYRIPAYEVLFSKNEDFCGKFCGKVQNVQFKQFLKSPTVKSDDPKLQIPALVRLMVWLGHEKDENEWHKMQREGNLSVLAETYENEWFIIKWMKNGPGRPAWSDASGRVEILKEKLNPPPGWKWDKDWYVSPELSLFYDKDAGHSEFTEDVYVNETRLPGGAWQDAKVKYTDVKGDPYSDMQSVKLPEGWRWKDEWKVDFNRPCDEEGWEYTVEASMGGYVPVEKMFHMCRRRRYIRARVLAQAAAVEENQPRKGPAEITDPEQCWEYAIGFGQKFHTNKRPVDMVRRRRWHRKMVPTKPGAPCFFNMTESSGDNKALMAAPRMVLLYDNSRKWQLRAYVFQARDLLAGDQSGLSDPYARVCFHTRSGVTETIDQSLCPTWDQTLIFDNVEMFSDPYSIEANPPPVVVEIFDADQLGEDEFLGRALVQPMVKLDPTDPRRPVLQWHPIFKGSKEGGELLAAFELFLSADPMPPTPPKRGSDLFVVPDGIKPVLQRTGIEILCWGVRNMQSFQLMSVTSPSVEFEIGGHQVISDVIKNTKRNPNFQQPLLFMDVMLPKETLYLPPMNIRVRDHRQFGRKPMVGLHVIKCLDEYRTEPLSEEFDAISNFPALLNAHSNERPVNLAPKVETEVTTKAKALVNLLTSLVIDISQLDEDIDWWSKYYASTGDVKKCRKYVDLGYDTLKLYTHSLEFSENFDNFSDFCSTYGFQRGKNLDDDEGNVVGEFKGTFRIYPLPEDLGLPLPLKQLEKGIPDSNPVDCIVRVYTIKAIDLQPNDPSGLADPYVEIELGKKRVDNKDKYIPNCLSPVFGQVFELKCILPIDKDLYIRIKDYDFLSSDDVIGETVIDLENRYLSKFNACVGLPQSYYAEGPNQWRDSRKPKEILADFCGKNYLPEPQFEGTDCLRLGAKTFYLDSFEPNRKSNPHYGPDDERLALHVLNCLPLVKEHVETRPLYSPLQPGIEQGKLQCWVDIFPAQFGTPPIPINIEPRKPKDYELRIIIWNTKDVVLEEISITGEAMSDIYVKGWLAGIDEKQETDVHYRSLDGEGNFNWRFKFPMQYLPTENVMVVKKKEHIFSLDATEQFLPPNLVVQIWDNDKFSADDFLGTLELNLSSMPAPKKKSRQCGVDQLPAYNKDIKLINLFECKRAYGYWPCVNDEKPEDERLTGFKHRIAGKIEMELELLTAEEAALRPAGLGQDEPNENPHLDPPKRPETSFLWFTSPWKTFKYIVWKNFKWYIIGALLTVVFGLLLVLFIYAIPGLTARRMVGV
ncbi:hypothetical protein BOX15_Mlig001839g4 [Macrostomum lignano]|uniref:C2 domain-containing protein n=1 Tax=Macrostomum lignano TaxID=282301 RepID=A0A267FV95_9PLAT|nr:hypothetical protein BOX15_Mlig001839g4 [Macrostomum lignano]